MTSEYEILLPDTAMVMKAVQESTAKKFIDNPVQTLQNLDYRQIEERSNYILGKLKEEDDQK